MGLNILIVDDSSLTRKAIRRMIDMVQLDVEEIYEAGNGIEALMMLNGGQRVDFVLADLNMPKMGGLEMIHTMKSDRRTSDIPVAVVSTESSLTRIEDLLEQGVMDFLHKPFSPAQFRDLIQRSFGEHTDE